MISMQGDNKVVNRTTLYGKVVCGYQGWFAAEGDGSNRGFYHWRGRNGFKPGSCNIDLWPDLTEFDKSERYPTPFRHADGSVAEVFSSFNGKTVRRHFEWMRDYGIDSAFAQRFIMEVSQNPSGQKHFDTVLSNIRESANKCGRSFAVMYDLSGLPGGQIERVMEDWKRLVDEKYPSDPAYQKHKGKPVVTVWGFGFNDGRKYTLAEGLKLVDFLKNDAKYGGNTVMLGIPTYWRTMDRDTVNDPMLHELLLKADIISPWAVGRFGTLDGVRDYAEKVLTPDIAWCAKNDKDFMPVVFPGFSWHNMNPRSKPNQIPRLGGDFLWEQYLQAKRVGAKMIYQAMFDEVDEATAILKCTNNPPVGESTFITYDGLPSDHYLRLVGTGGRLLRGEIPATPKFPDLYKK